MKPTDKIKKQKAFENPFDRNAYDLKHSKIKKQFRKPEDIKESEFKGDVKDIEKLKKENADLLRDSKIKKTKKKICMNCKHWLPIDRRGVIFKGYCNLSNFPIYKRTLREDTCENFKINNSIINKIIDDERH